MTHILFLMSDTGGGHRAACRAIIAALQSRYPDRFTFELVDVWKDYTIFPFNRMPQYYSEWVNLNEASYVAQFWLGDHLLRYRLLSDGYGMLLYSRMKRLYAEHPADIVIGVHSIFVRPAVYALRREHLKQSFITVVTDYAWPIVLWYDPQVDRCLVPTEPAYRRGLTLGMTPGQMLLTGAPVHPKFANLHLTQQEARAELGWDADARIVLMLGGGDGMGPLIETARAVDARPLDCQMVIVSGRNQPLRAALEATTWQRPTKIYGFVDNMEVMMRAADLLVTKAGPGTITEAATIGLPMVLSGAIRFQESPNVDYVVAKGAGVYAPGPERVAESVEKLLMNNGIALQALALAVKQIAQPDAIWQIAAQIESFAG